MGIIEETAACSSVVEAAALIEKCEKCRIECMKVNDVDTAGVFTRCMEKLVGKYPSKPEELIVGVDLGSSSGDESVTKTVLADPSTPTPVIPGQARPSKKKKNKKKK